MPSCSKASATNALYTFLLVSVSRLPSSQPMTLANSSAPSPTSITWGASSSTLRATLMGWMKPFNAPTAPVLRVLPHMRDASISWTPRMLGMPPRPTDVSSGLLSTSLVAASTASRAEPPSARTLTPA